MKYSRFGWFGVLVAMAGCVSAPRVVMLPPLGPAPGQLVKGQTEGFLEVFSAREPAVANPDAQEFFWNNDFGKNAFLHGPAHTDYSVYSEDGKLVRRVHNSNSNNDPQPVLVPLQSGTYRVEALAEDYDAVTFTAMVPMVIKPGATTIAYLEQKSGPSAHDPSVNTVRLPNGRVAGWLASSVAANSVAAKPADTGL